MKSTTLVAEIKPSGPALTRAFRSRNYRLWFIGQGISLIGSWMQTVALSWLVYRLTGSAFLLGLVGFVSQVPALIVTPFAGVLVDRLNRLQILIVTQTLMMLQAFLLTALVLTGRIQVWQLIPLSLFLGVVNAVDAPTRQAFVVQIIDRREDLGNAIALNSAMFNGARLVGPSFAGMILAAAGEGICFLINGVSFLAVIGALLAMRVEPIQVPTAEATVIERLHEGLRYAWHFTPIRALLLLVSWASFMGMPYMVLLPVFAQTVLSGGPEAYGFLLAAAGTGALIGAVYLASRRGMHGLWETVAVAAILFGTGLVALSFSRTLWLSLLALMWTGFGMMVQMASTNTLLQTIVEEDKRGRVVSLYTMAFMGFAPFGSLLAGGLANSIGAPETLLLGGLLCVAAAGVFVRTLPELKAFSAERLKAAFLATPQPVANSADHLENR